MIVLSSGVCHPQESVEKDRRIMELSVSHDSKMQKLDTELCSTRLQLEAARTE